MEDYRKKVRELLEADRLRTLYANTFYSLTDRIDETGYLEESFVPGRYPGCFARSAGAYVFLMTQAGEIELAVRALRFVLDSMRRNCLSRPPHVLGKPSYEPDGRILQKLDMVCQIDGTAHILSAYAELVLVYKREELFEEYWEMIAEIMDAHADQPYFFSNEICSFPVANVKLFLNTSFEHSREERYWCCFDLLTQSFFGAALEKMTVIAGQHRQEWYEGRWGRKLELLREGIQKHLTREDAGKTVYMEMRLPDENDGKAYAGMGWVNYGPVAADWEALPHEVMRNTVESLRRRLWKEDPDTDELHFLSKDAEPDGSFCLETIGKGIGWDIEAALSEGDYQHIYEQLLFLEKKHKEELYGECMYYKDGKWRTRDCGNAEQCIWWCRAVCRLRKALGMAGKPERRDITIHYSAELAYSE